ncbi:hypothetical protein ACHQM5_023480 [Ranunculus cassubicifolius]
MADGVDEGLELLTVGSLSSSTQEKTILENQEIEKSQSLSNLQEKIVEVKTCVQGSERNAKEFEVLKQRVKDTAKLLTFLKTKVALMPIPQLVHTLNGIRHHGDNNGSHSSCEHASSVTETQTHVGVNARGVGVVNESDGGLVSEILKSIHMITDLVEVLVQMVIMAETEISVEKEKVTLGQEEIKRKVLQIESMSAKVEEMERFAVGTNCLLNEMQQKVEDMVLETSRQRQRAAENEQELFRVKQDFESLRSYVGSLISVREMLLSSENHQTSEMQLERVVALAAQLEGEKVKKEAEVQKLMAENIRLTSMLDKKEAQLLAMNEQCKVMALNSYGP